MEDGDDVTLSKMLPFLHRQWVSAARWSARLLLP